MSRAFIRQNVLDGHGRAIVGAQVEVFEIGTTTEVDVYGATTGGSPLAQPLATNQQGEIVGYVDVAQQLDLRVSDGSGTAYLAVDSGTMVTFPTFTETVDAMPAAGDIAMLGAAAQEFTGDVAIALARFASEPHANVRHPAYGAVGSGAVDDTSAIQMAVAAGLNVFIPAGSYRVSGSIAPRDGQIIVLDPGARLWFAPGSSGGIPIFDISGVSDVWLVGGELDGNKTATPTATNGLYGVMVRGACERVRVCNVNAHDFPSSTATGGNGGDGFYVGKTGTDVPDDVRFVDCVGHDCVRQGWSIVAGKRVWLVRPHAYNITGTSGGNGIDIEPAAGTVCDGIYVLWADVHDCSKGAQVGNSMTGLVVFNGLTIRNITDATNGHGLEVGNGTATVIVNLPYIEACALDCVTLGTNPGVTISGGKLKNADRYGVRMQGARQKLLGTEVECDADNGVRLESIASDCKIADATFLLTAGVFAAIRSDNSKDHTIEGCTFVGHTTASSLAIDINAPTSNGTGHLIVGNRGRNMAKGLDLDAGTTANRAYGNDFTGCTTPITNLGTGNVVAPAAANPDTSGATLAALETEVNELKAALRALQLIAT